MPVAAQAATQEHSGNRGDCHSRTITAKTEVIRMLRSKAMSIKTIVISALPAAVKTAVTLMIPGTLIPLPPAKKSGYVGKEIERSLGSLRHTI